MACSGVTVAPRRCSSVTQAPSDPAEARRRRQGVKQRGLARRDDLVALAVDEAQLAVRVETLPAVPHVEVHARHAQPVQPGAQQRRGLQVGRKDAARGADEVSTPSSRAPGADGLAIKDAQPGLDVGGFGTEASQEGSKGSECVS